MKSYFQSQFEMDLSYNTMNSHSAGSFDFLKNGSLTSDLTRSFIVGIENYSIYRGKNGLNYYITANQDGKIIKFKYFSEKPLFITKNFNNKFQITASKRPRITIYKNLEVEQFDIDTIVQIAFPNQPTINVYNK